MCILLFCLLVPKGLLLGRINSRRGQISLASALAILLMRELAYSSISPRFLLLTLPIFPCALLISILLLEHGGQERPSLANSLIGLAASAAFYLADLWLVGLVPHASLAALCIITVSLSVLMTQQLPLSLVEFEHEFSRTFFMIAISMFVTAKTMGLSVSGFDLCVVAVVYVGTFRHGVVAHADNQVSSVALPRTGSQGPACGYMTTSTFVKFWQTRTRGKSSTFSCSTCRLCLCKWLTDT